MQSWQLHLSLNHQVKHELRVTSCELRVESLKARIEIQSSNARVTSSNPRVTSSNSRVTSSNPRVTSSNTQVTSSNPWIIKWIKTQVSSLKSSSFPKILSPKLFSSSWGNLYFQFLVIISCFTFSLLHGYGFSRKLSEYALTSKEENLNSPQKSHPFLDDFGDIFTRN